MGVIAYKDLGEVKRIIKESIKPLGEEIIDTRESIGRFIAEDIYVFNDVPECDIAHYDGFAINLVSGKTEYNVISGSVSELRPGEATYIVTGECLPAGVSVVVPVEAVTYLSKDLIKIPIDSHVAYRDSVFRRGSEFSGGGILVKRGDRVSPLIAKVLLDLGIEKIKVFKRPRVAILPTGTEFVENRSRETNSLVIKYMCESMGALVSVSEPSEDSEDVIMSRVKELINDFDMIITIGGLGEGYRDHTLRAVEGIKGSNVLVRGIKIQPGRRTSYVKIYDKPAVLSPGFMQSSIVSTLIITQPIIDLLQGGSGETHVVKGLFRLAEDYVYTGKFRDFIKVRFVELIDKENLLIKIIETNPRASIPISRSHGLVFIDPINNILRKNDLVPVYDVPGLLSFSLS